MKNKNSAWEHVQLGAAIADLKNDHYRTLLALSATLELLIDKGLLTREEIERKSALLEAEMDNLIGGELRPMG
ncbi:hypothetical protein IJ21_04070 [Paenibacillus sp. 32O-W]|jgi:hypothetical protein|uniref:Uncharacterized protein n=1 Tax=Paenibacillus cisolokensis TaxID=1658519 RepID=A0ABQ4N720_9BACL|nr:MULTISPECIES: hypothetical protein [Paenibacillus]ALS25839.1 hypothetical protein IJ21_04070 [Paenibacillus sp. 32O-W]GIQ63941.1 hypothetical protein PACILC2_25090 [Paenibacillus cisolokensis]